MVADSTARRAATDSELCDQMVNAVRSAMVGAWIYRGLTADEAWVGRSKEMVAQRLRWWLRAVTVQVDWRS